MILDMIQRMSHVSQFVTNQDTALDFYVNKLGFDLKMDVSVSGFGRWLTVSPKGQPDFELILLPVNGGPKGTDAETAAQLTSLLSAGRLATCVLQTADCQQTYQELTANGVEFLSPPKEQFYGIEAVFKDPFGNRFSLQQPKSAVKAH